MQLSLLFGIGTDVVGGNEVNIGDLDAKRRHLSGMHQRYSCMSCRLIWPLATWRKQKQTSTDKVDVSGI